MTTTPAEITKFVEEMNQLFPTASVNTRKADIMMLTGCGESIPLIYRRESKGNVETVRINRIDCEFGKDEITTYHLVCYDKAVIGHVHGNTIKQIKFILDNLRAGMLFTK